MISCTEFIYLYSEFFKYLESKGGYDAVLAYWKYVSENRLGDTNNPLTLASFIEREGGFLGSVNYWNLTLKEEACDLYQIYNPKLRYNYQLMRRCPSKGRLLELGHVEPYPRYCEHCKVIFSLLLEKHGIVYERDHSMVDKACCSSILYEKGNKPDIDYTQPTEDCIVTDINADDNKYFHPGFHISCDIALRYCGQVYGDGAVTDFLANYTRTYYAPKIDEIKRGGLSVLADWITSVYESEDAADDVHILLEGNTVSVRVDKGPDVCFMKRVNHTPSKYHVERTRTLYRTLAEECGLKFNLVYFNIEDGSALYTFKS